MGKFLPHRVVPFVGKGIHLGPMGASSAARLHWKAVAAAIPRPSRGARAAGESFVPFHLQSGFWCLIQMKIRAIDEQGSFAARDCYVFQETFLQA